MSPGSNDAIADEAVSADRVGVHYVDFQLRAWKADASHVQVLVHASPAGGMRQPVTVAFDRGRIERVRKAIEDDMAAMSGDLGRMIDVGRGLAEVLLPDPVRTLLDRSLERIRTGDGLRLRLCLDDELVDLPWEFMYQQPLGGGDSLEGFLVLDQRIAVVREPPTALLRISPSNRRQRLVFAGTMFTDATNSDLWEVKGEHERLVAALDPVADYLSVPFVTAAEDHIESALATRTDIFHYAGHADVTEGHGYLIRDLQGGQVGGTLMSEALDGLLVRAETRLAAFSACNSGRWSFVGPLVRAGVPVVIGIQGNVFNVTATAFFEKLYASLAVGMSLDEAVSWARLHLLEPGVGMATDSSEWGAFMVYMPTTEAVLFPRPRTRAVRDRQAAARRDRQQTIYNVTQIIQANYGQVTGVADRASPIGGDDRRDEAEPEKPARPVKILFLAANPVDGERLRLDEEVRAIDEALRTAEYRDRFELEQQWALRIGDLQEALLRHRPDIVHFSGHGTDTSEIVLEDDTGAGQVVPQAALSGLFSVLGDDIRCVVLNACYSERQARAIAETIDCVVGMTNAVGDDAAVEFATAFYRALGYGESVQTAFDLGTNQIALGGGPDEDVPHLLADKVRAAEVSFVRSA